MIEDLSKYKHRALLDIKVPSEELSGLLDYLIRILERNPNLHYLNRSIIEGIGMIQYRISIMGGRILDIVIKATSEKIEIYYYSEERINEREYRILDLEIENMIRSYFRETSSLFLVFSPKMDIFPKREENRFKKIIGSIVFGNFLYLFMLIIIFGIILYQFFEMMTPLILVALQFLILIFAHKLIGYRGEFDITEDNSTIHIAEVKMRAKEFEEILKICYPKIKEIKKEIYDATLA
ncbi:MAG: hypothetical protein N3D72_02400, partial [Candidatus Methanomethyliaceae archaeon]|nr:hypothetical protein [Candidatus Methanomethyliaceae archaeon]